MVGVLTRTKKFVFRAVRRLPYIGSQIDAKVDKERQELEETFHKMAKGHSYLQKLPANGMSEVAQSPKVLLFVCDYVIWRRCWPNEMILPCAFILHWINNCLFNIVFLHISTVSHLVPLSHHPFVEDRVIELDVWSATLLKFVIRILELTGCQAISLINQHLKVLLNF